MSDLRLMKKIICGKEGKPAYILDAADKVLRLDYVRMMGYFYGTAFCPKTSTKGGSAWVTDSASPDGTQYCSALFYSFGWIAKCLRPVAEDAAINDGTDFIVYDCFYGDECEVKTKMRLDDVTEEEAAEAKDYLKELCEAFPEYNYLLEFCRIYGEYLANEDGPNFKFFHESDKTYYELFVDLFGQEGYHFQLHCCRKGPDMPYGLAFG